MADRAFLDTNVLIYAADLDQPAKRARAREVLASPPSDGYVVSTQVLGEFFNVATGKVGWTVETAAEAVRTFSALARVPVDLDLVYSAIEPRGSKSVSHRDALIIAAAARADCSQLITEDLNAGEVIAGVEIVNPFAER